MNIYRVIHRPSGMFYRPCRGAVIRHGEYSRYVKSNLSAKPKLYQSRPSIRMLSGSYYNHLSMQERVAQFLTLHPKAHIYDVREKNSLFPILGSEWQVERLEGTEWKSEGDLKP